MVKYLQSLLVGTGAVVFATSSLFAGTPKEATDSYDVISRQNVFHLVAAPIAAPAETAPLPNVKITGIMKVGGDLKALFALPSADAKDQPKYLCLAEGQQEGTLELTKISAEKEECEVVNAGTKMTLSFKNNSYASVPAKTALATPPRP